MYSVSASEYPALFRGCQTIWMNFWSKDSLIGEATYFLNKFSLTKDCEADLTYATSR